MSALHQALFGKLATNGAVGFPTLLGLSRRRTALGGFAKCRGGEEERRPSRRALLLLTGGVCGSRLCSRGSSARAGGGMAESQKSEEGPESFRYSQIWVSSDGESHIKECKMSGFRTQSYSSMPQFVKDEFGGQPEKIIFTELSVGMEQPLHTCPQVQFVVTLSGSWYVKTTDGSKYVFQPGEVLFQDNTKNSPAQKPGQHLSGAVGDVPCQQFIVQFNRAPEVDNPNPF